MIKGTAKFDGVAVGELTANFVGPTLRVSAKAAFVDSRTGNTHGWTECTQWSPAVIEKLKELRTLLEMDFATIHFGDSVSSIVGPSMPAALRATTPTGLGEHLNDAPSI